MARLSDRLPENVEGEFFVDSTCIDCETCMIVAPETFAESSRNLSYVHRQPEGAAATKRAQMAMIACPTASIGTVHKLRGGAEAARAFPDRVADDVYYLGYASEDSFGASSYLIRRQPAGLPAGGGPGAKPRETVDGNVLVDSPRAAAPLLDGIEKLGGARWLFLTHRDDVADHEKLRERFGCDRVMHAADARGMEVERRVDGDEPVALADDLLLIPVPGHTRGSTVLKHGRTLFTGDHLWADADGRLGASRSVSWFSWGEQTRSMEKLLDYEFDTVLPGHGRRYHASSVTQAHDDLAALVARMKRR